MEYITCLCWKTSKCLTATCECRDNGLHCTDLSKCSGCRNEGNVEKEEWNYSDIDSDNEDEFIIQRLYPEAVVQTYSVKKLFLKIPQNSQENICVEVSF